jgi:aminopeptidase N
VLINDDDLTYAKTRLDEHSLRTLISAIGEFQDSLPAALCWSAAWDMCRDAEMAARDYVRLVMSGLDSVGDISVAQTLLRQAGASARRYTDPAWRDTGLRLIAATLRELLQRAEAGSDRQLAYLQALTGVAAEPGDLALLRGLLDGSTALDGLAVDTELRWRLLHRLVSRGAAGPTEIAAELARDATDAGERRAASCRAAIPEPDARQAAWDAIISGTLPNAMFRAVLSGFVDPDQPDLLRPYAQRYFDVIGDIWRDWSSAMAQWFVNNAYPLFLVSQETVRMTDEYIARANPPAPLHRLLSECRDSVQRALRCQERDRQEG